MSITSEIKYVTPELAKLWLSENERNRNLNTRRVTELARAIANGEWRMNGEAIKRAEDGTLLDGQHRLGAVIEADTPISMLVVQGLPNDTQETMDLGRKRTTADAWKLRGEINVNVLASVARRTWMWDSGNHKFGNHLAPTPGELRAHLDANPSLRRSAEIGSRVNGHFRPASATTTGIAHHLFHRIDQGDAAEFFARIETGANMDLGDPVLTLRERLMRDQANLKKVPPFVQIAYFIKAWNAVREGRELNTILQTAENHIPKPI